MTITLSYLQPIWPELFLAVSGLLLVVIGVIKGNQGTKTISRAVIVTLGLAGLFLNGLDWSSQTIFDGMFIFDALAGFSKTLILLGLISVLAIGTGYLYQERIQRFEYPLLVLFSGIGMLLLTSAHHFLILYLALELQSLALYILAAFKRESPISAEAGIKYFVLGALSSGMLLFGISMIYGFTGALSYDGVAQAIATNPGVPGVSIGMVFVLAGMAFKLSAVPFHMWTPDVYQGAPTITTALFAIVPKLAALVALMRLLFEPFGLLSADWVHIIWLLSAASMAVGAFAALGQTSIKRLLAYSSIGHIGYALIGVVAGGAEGLGASLTYFLIYMVMSAGTFGVILSLRRDGHAEDDIESVSGLSRTNPVLALVLAVMMFSMAGLPPLAGFLGKLLIFESAVAAGYTTLAVLGVLSSVVAAYYYLRIVKVMYFDEPNAELDNGFDFSRRIVIAISALFVVGFIFVPDGLVSVSLQAARTLSPNI